MENIEAYLGLKEVVSKSELEEYFIQELKKIHRQKRAITVWEKKRKY